MMVSPSEFRPMQSRGDRASPWYMLYLKLTWPIGFEKASRVVFHSPVEFLMKALNLPLLLYSSKHSNIHVNSVES